MSFSALKLFSIAYHRMVRMHPAERGRDLWFQEEARAERLSNFIRLFFVLAWLSSTCLHAPGNNFWMNLSNLGVGVIWLLWGLGVQYWLTKHAYRPWHKFLTTGVDLFLITAMIFVYQFGSGPAFCLKVPTYFNYFFCIGLASLRFKRSLAVFAGSVAMALYVFLFLYLHLHYGIVYGTNIESTISEKVNAHYVIYQFVYLGVFSFMTYVIAVNVKRLVEMRAFESEMAHRAQERAVVAAGVAHEIKNPLEGIYGAAQLLQEEGKGNPRFIQMILKDSIRLNETVQQFLRFSRPFATHTAAFDVVAFVREFCREQNEIGAAQGTANAGGAPFAFDSNKEAQSLLSDEEGLRQILLNLVQNARRYQPAGKPVRINTEVRDDVVEIRVEDEGEGVPEAKRKQLFEPFFTTSARGTGLGLAISRKIARELGGDLYYEPMPVGSRFVLVVRNHESEEKQGIE